MAKDNQHCGYDEPHPPHTWYSPALIGTGQDEHHCPGTQRMLCLRLFQVSRCPRLAMNVITAWVRVGS
jgi:hypothetical protein